MLRATILTAALLIPALLGPATAAAGSGDGWFVQLYSGLGLTEASDLRVRVPDEGLDLTFRHIEWEDYSLSQPSIPYIGVRAGRWLDRRPWLGLAIDVMHFKVFARTERTVEVSGTFDGTPIVGVTRLGQIVQRYNVGNGVNMYLLTALARQRRGVSDDWPDGRWSPYAGVGLGGTWLYTHSTVLGESREGYEVGKLAAQLLAGAEVRINRRFYLFGEYKRTRTDANGSVVGGDSETRLDSDHFVVGAGYRF